MAKKVEVSKTEPRAGGVPTRSGGAANPLLALRQEMDRLFEEFASDWRLPSLSRDPFDWARLRAPGLGRDVVDVRFDLSETDDAIELTAEMPGIDEKNVELTLSDGVLTIKGEKRAEKEEKDKDYVLSERRYGAFARSLRLPDSVDPNKVMASFDKGVLKITAPKRAEAKAQRKKIPIAKK